jgi:alanine dehydrogenase
MKKIVLGILREGKIPVDRRVPFTPQQAREIMVKFPHVTVVLQHSRIRCFKDSEYGAAGIRVVNDVDGCDVLMGIKEVPVSNLLAGKTYLFFSHTMKMQQHNQKLLQIILKKRARLIDYEALRDEHGERLVAFGRYAGIVGAYNCLWAYGVRYKGYTLRRAYKCRDFAELRLELGKVRLPPVRIILTGSGRVGKGAVEILHSIGIRRVEIKDFLDYSTDEPVYVHLSSQDYYAHIEHKGFNREEFHHHPERYESTFLKFAQKADMLIAGAYWNPGAPMLFTKEDMTNPAFTIRIIADISCDINGSIPATIKATDVNDPIYDYNPFSQQAEAPLSGEKFITVMAVDNLPCELPRSSSEDFGRDLIDKILPSLVGDDKEGIIERATLTKDGKLTEGFLYLKEYAFPNSTKSSI